MKISKKSLIWGMAILIIIVLLYVINMMLGREDFFGTIKCNYPTPIKNNNKCESCNSKTPYWNKNKCVARCPSPSAPYLDTTTNPKQPTCVARCPSPSAPYLDTTTNQNQPTCVAKCPSPSAPYLDTTTNPKQPTCTKCPSTTPYWNSSTGQCVSCPPGEYWNVSTNICIPANTKNKCQELDNNFDYLYWDESSSKCVIGDSYCDNISKIYFNKGCIDATNDNCITKCQNIINQYNTQIGDKLDWISFKLENGKSNKICNDFKNFNKDLPYTQQNIYCNAI